MPKSRWGVEDACQKLGSRSAEKKQAAQNLLRVKLFMGGLGSRRHYGHENAQKQANCGRCLARIGQQERGEEAGCPKLSEIGQSPRNQTANTPKVEKMQQI